MRNILVLAIVILALCSVPVCGSTLDIPGTGDGVAVLKALAAAFEKETGIVVQIPESIGSSGGIVAAGTDKVEIARVARKIKEKEQPLGLTYRKVFSVPTVFFVNGEVAVDGLTSAQVLDIFSGKIDNWEKVGGSNMPIMVIVREQKDSSLNNLKETFPGFKDLAFAEMARVAPKTPFMVNIVLNEKGAIGFGPLDVALLNGLKVLAVDGKKPTDAGYPYHGEIGLVYKPENTSDNAKKFLGFIDSGKARSIIEASGGLVR